MDEFLYLSKWANAKYCIYGYIDNAFVSSHRFISVVFSPSLRDGHFSPHPILTLVLDSRPKYDVLMNSLITLLQLIRNGAHTVSSEYSEDALHDFQRRVLAVRTAEVRGYIDKPAYHSHEDTPDLVDMVTGLKLTSLGHSLLDR